MRHSIIDTFMVCPRSCTELGQQDGARAKNNNSVSLCSFYPDEQGSSNTHILVEAITFECQKIILAVIFSNIRGTAKAMNGHGGKGNDLLLSPVTVHNSISNIFFL